MSEWRWRPATYNNPAGFHGFGPDEEKAALKEGLLTPDRARYQVRQRFELFLLFNKRSFYQDRLGTNIGKTHRKRTPSEQVRDVATGKPMLGGLARGSVNWNSYRQKYLLRSILV